MLVLPVLIYDSDTRTLSKCSENMLNVFETKMLRKIYGSVNTGRTWK